jgi:ubiquinone/menaquinone biosynthesis C-methylase UbiE
VKAYYEARAGEYDDWWLGRGLYAGNRPADWHDERDLLTRWISELPQAHTLDVACGTGFLTRHLRGEVVGLDQSASMLEVAGAQAPHVEFVQGDALALPFEDGSFDRVFASYFYCHLEEEERLRFLAEAWRVAAELVVVASVRKGGVEPARWEERVLSDGTRWQVYKRYFEPESLAAEVGGGVLFQNQRFVVVQA